ncbi:MAG TPA: hypothetical protein VFE58_16970 [Tepidisphaeraceae bacterium]|jgi:hypothetical protein|nr:hypothetical protein [Tepidisphaeraceae bacterium]
METTTTQVQGILPVWEKLRAATKKDPKKAGILIFLGMVMVGLWAKNFSHSQPAAAGAAEIRGAAATGGGGGASFAVVQPGSDKVRGNQAGRVTWTGIKLAPASRNLFKVDYDRYQQSGKSTTPGASVQQSKDSTADQAKSGPTPADLKKERQILANNLQAQATQLKLQTIVMGAQPKAVVNGSLVGEGDTVASFRIVKITARGMVIEREGIKLEVQMK